MTETTVAFDGERVEVTGNLGSQSELRRLIEVLTVFGSFLPEAAPRKSIYELPTTHDERTLPDLSAIAG